MALVIWQPDRSTCPKIELKLQPAFGGNPGVTSETGENDHFNSPGPSQ